MTPARAFVRHVSSDVEINGQRMKKDQYVYLMYMAANRDPSVFEKPHKFDVGRSNASRHLGFGAGPHVCLGARLARMEGAEVLNALLDRFDRIEIASEPERVKNHLIRNSWETMPLRLVR